MRSIATEWMVVWSVEEGGKGGEGLSAKGRASCGGSSLVGESARLEAVGCSGQQVS